MHGAPSPFHLSRHMLIKKPERDDIMSLITYPYNRSRTVAYARRWALSRNPLFHDFTGGGGNCTNFVSQCLLAGCCQMNFTDTFGWYYLSVDDRAAAWTGVEFFYNFMTGNNESPIGDGSGPFAEETGGNLLPGDVIQLGRLLPHAHSHRTRPARLPRLGAHRQRARQTSEQL